MSEKKHDCWKCQYRTEGIPGSAHIGCSLLEEKRLTYDSAGRIMGIFAAMSGSVPKGIEVNEHGRRNGWAAWPVDFDPVWIEKCVYFETKK